MFGGLPCRRSLSPRMSPSSAPVFSCAHYFQAPATQASVWISDETLLLVFDVSPLSVWISDETLLLVFDTTLLGVWISDDKIHLVFGIINCEIRQCL